METLKFGFLLPEHHHPQRQKTRPPNGTILLPPPQQGLIHRNQLQGLHQVYKNWTSRVDASVSYCPTHLPFVNNLFPLTKPHNKPIQTHNPRLARHRHVRRAKQRFRNSSKSRQEPTHKWPKLQRRQHAQALDEGHLPR